ncbi:hypothetical protein CGI80_00475 [Vibrio parahaemolyticus]|uniref:hypothetical protein n=1 Tax=Vibrionaceae TaxID=641 RepID=UPI00111E6415|nr:MULTISPECIES: hypothetical protein [Vibrionaceae]QSV13273.1 hypothetical protein FH974_11025 [Photobacterium ganghwense]TOH54195.1 hypothetical protein CGI80_00475 [Vibrio parahaemolyticus]
MLSSLGGPAILIFAGALISATGAIWASIEQTKNEQALRKKSEEIADLNKEISKSITGGDSFPYLLPSSQSGTSYPESLMIINEGKHPLYDVNLHVVDIDELETELAKPKGQSNLLNVGINVEVGNVSPGVAVFSGISMHEKDYTRLTIQFSARNGHFSQALRIIKVGSEYKTAFNVTKDGASIETIFEKIGEGYPLNDNGEVNW